MKSTKPILALQLLLCFSVLAFVPYLPFFGPASGGSPVVTPATMGAYVWYEASRTGLPTNGALVTFSNLASTGSALDMTNQSFVSTSIVVQAASLNGLDTLWFKGGRQLHVWNYSVPAVTQEFFFLLSYTNTGGASRGLFAGMTTTNGYRWRHFNSSTTWQMAAGVFGGDVATVTSNRYMLFNLVYRGSLVSLFLTNGVAGLSPLALPLTNMMGFQMPTVFGGDSLAVYSLAAACSFTQELTAIERSNVTWYFTNRFSTNGFGFGQ